MSAAPLNLALTLSLNDRLVAPLQRALGQAQKQLADVSRELGGVERTGAAAARGLAQVGRQAEAVKGATAEVRKLKQETMEAERSASRLASVWGTVRAAARGIGAVAGGAAAFGAVAAAPLRRAADYDTQLRSLANTAFAGQSLDARRAGMQSLGAAVTSAVRYGGGTRDAAMEALNELVASGVFKDAKEASQLLPGLQRASTASGASPVELARIAIRAQQTFGLTGAQMPGVLDQALAAGQAGGFELRDMAKWLPQQMAAARQLGLSGNEGLIKLLAANQASVITAGTKDEAGNNLVNLLAKVNSADTANDFKKLGIDLPGSLAKARGNGVDGLTAFVNFVDQLVAKDERFQAAKRGMNAEGKPFRDAAERRAAFESQADILQGSAVGKVIQDRQALMALIALMNNREYLGGVEKTIRGSQGATGDAFALMREGAGYAFDQREFEAQQAQTAAMTTANSAIVKLAQAQVDLYQRYPGFAEAVEGAKVALTALAAAGAAAGAINLLSGGAGAAVKGAAGAAGARVAVGAGAAAAAARLGGGAAGAALKKAGPLALLSELFFTSDSDVELLKAAEQRAQGYRGKGFTDPRVLPGFTTGSMEGDEKLAAAADQHARAAADLQAAAAALKQISVVPAETALFTDEITRQVLRDSRRN